MTIIFKDTFLSRLRSQIKYISNDSPNRATKFKKDLFHKIRSVPKNLTIYRKSIYFDDYLIRDLIFKGYTIVFRINENTIEVFGFVHYHKKVTD